MDVLQHEFIKGQSSVKHRAHFRRHVKTIVAMSLTVLIGFGCGRGIKDLQQYVDEVKARKAYAVEPLPEVKPYESFVYGADAMRNPFDPGELTEKVVKHTQPNNLQLSPDPNRVPEFLEAFPLDTLRMVGSLAQGNNLWALIQTPDSTIQRVTYGNYMGQNYGKIVGVSEADIHLTEIIPDGFGGWRERASSIALSE